MAEKPTYDELAQRVKELEAERFQARVKRFATVEGGDYPTEKMHPETISKVPVSGLDLGSIIDVTEIQSIMDDFYSLTGMVTAILDLNGKVIESTGWQDICAEFDRVNPQSSHNCTESDLFTARNLKAGEYIDYKCKNGLSDVVTPLFFGSKHLGNIFTGQFFYDDEIIDEEEFVKQAEKYGFDKKTYLEAFRKIPRYSRKKIDDLMSFLVKFATYISRIHHANIQLEREIEERLKAESAQKESVAMLQSLIRAIPDLVWLKDKRGVYLYCNSRFESLYGVPGKDIIGKTDYDFVEADLADFFRKHDKLAMANDKPNKNEEELVFASDGHSEILETIKTSLYDSNGTIVGVLGIGRDITERKRAAEEKDILSSQLQQAQKMEAIGILAGGVAHDFNNMLGVIIGHSEMAMEQVDPTDPIFVDLNQIRKAAERSADISRQLLAFARKQTIAPKVLDLNDAVTGMLKLLRPLIGEDIELVWLPGAELWQVKVDPSQIDRILANLCVNARAAIAGVGKITVATENSTIDIQNTILPMVAIPGEYVKISVSDSGCGMDKRTLSKIFEPFFTTKNIGKGTGLGLATVFGVVKQNNGFIDVCSEPEEGSSFKIYLPRYLGENGQSRQDVEIENAAHGHETILLVEDEPTLLGMTMAMLQRLGYSVLPAGSPEDAIRLTAEYTGKIDMIMTDVVMPGMNGKVLASRILAINPAMKCLFMSGYTANVISHQGVLDDGLCFIQKPFSKKELSVKVRRIFGAK